MPYRVFNLDEVADYLHLAHADVERLVKNKEIPCTQQGGRCVFRKQEIDSWASQRILGLSGTRLDAYHRASSARAHKVSPDQAIMPELLTLERIAPDLGSRTKASVLRDMVALANGTGLVADPRDLQASLENRERLCSTALAGGLALLHPRHHEPYMFEDSFVVLGRTVQPIHAGAQDGAPTDLFFLICCQDDRLHLHTLARLCSMSMNTGMLGALRLAPGAAEMLEALLTAESEVIRRL